MLSAPLKPLVNQIDEPTTEQANDYKVSGNLNAMHARCTPDVV